MNYQREVRALVGYTIAMAFVGSYPVADFVRITATQFRQILLQDANHKCR